jgi:hypothetical protein
MQDARDDTKVQTSTSPDEGTRGKEARSWIINVLRFNPRDDKLDQDV